jgi:hypothetical protein
MKYVPPTFRQVTDKKLQAKQIDDTVHYEEYREKLRAMWPYGPDLYKMVREEMGPRVLLKFSGGKDAIAVALAIREHFDEIVPLFLYLVPGLSFVDEAMDYYERKLFDGRKILKAPHPAVFEWMYHSTYMCPASAAVAAAANLPVPEYEDINEAVREQEGLPSNCLAATGVRYSVNMTRVQLVRKHGPILYKSGTWMPVWDWNKREVLDCLRHHDIKLSADYAVANKSFDGLHISYIYPIKKHFPEDYKKILEWFPLLDAEIWRHERAGVLPTTDLSGFRLRDPE